MSRRIPIHLRLLLAAALPAAVLFAGCGSASSPSGGTTSSPVVYGSESRLFGDGYTDPSAIKMQQGLYYLYLNNLGTGGGTSVLQSNDTFTWTPKIGVIFPGVSKGRAFRSDTGVRFYYPSQPVGSGQAADIISSFATDGITFTADAGTRISPRPGYSLGGMTVYQLAANNYRMLFEEFTLASGDNKEGVIWGASSTDGLTWVRDAGPTIEPQESVEGIVPFPQVLHPFVAQWPEGIFTVFYSSHSQVYAASSYDGINWTKTGTTGISGTDVDGIVFSGTAMRLFFDRYTTATGNEVYTAVLSK